MIARGERDDGSDGRHDEVGVTGLKNSWLPQVDATASIWWFTIPSPAVGR